MTLNLSFSSIILKENIQEFLKYTLKQNIEMIVI